MVVYRSPFSNNLMSKNFYIYFAVVVSGASVLAIEILGTRIIGPFYGVSLFLWSALISVTLAALSLGYAIGGQWADRGPRLSRLCVVLAIAGAWIVMIPLLRHPVLALTEPMGLRFAVLFAAFVLFFPPLTLLGMISPYAIRLKAHSIEVVGRTAGNLYAISTVASVASALLVGFFLIPEVGVSRLTFLTGALLVLTGIFGLAAGRRFGLAAGVFVVLTAAGSLAARVAPATRADTDAGLQAVENSPYAEIRVLDYKDARYMLIDGGTHCIVDRESGEPLFPYVDVLDISRRYFEKPGSMLLIGLGGGAVAKRFHNAGWGVEAVEIDPVVTRIAYQYFDLKPEDATVYNMDGRQYFITHDKRYDIVVMDAFGSSSIPFHLVTAESFGLIAEHLTARGVLAINIEANGWDDILVHSLGVTLQQHFSHVQIMPIEEPPNQSGNLVIMAANRELELVEPLPDPIDRFTTDYNRVHAWVNSFEPDPAKGQVLTDDLNPVALWAERINLVARHNLHDYFGPTGLSW